MNIIDNYVKLISEDYKSCPEKFGIAKYQLPEEKDYIFKKLLLFALNTKPFNSDLLKDVITHFENSNFYDIKCELEALLFLGKEDQKIIMEIYDISFYNELFYLISVPYSVNNSKVLKIILIFEEFKKYLRHNNLSKNDWKNLYDSTYNTDISSEIKTEYLKDQNFPEELISLVNDEMKQNASTTYMRDIVDDYHNLELREYFKLRMKGTMKIVAEKPSWIIPFNRNIKDEEVPYIPMKLIEKIKEPSDSSFKTLEDNIMNKSTDILIESTMEDLFRENGEVTEDDMIELKSIILEEFKEEYNNIYPIFAISSVKDKILMIKNLKIENTDNIEIYDDTDVFRVYGPVNPSWTDNNHGCNSLGGCRMFVCNFNETFEEEEYELEDDVEFTWFKRNCMNCGSKIISMKYAIRQPLQGGGWNGCYCSFECLENIPLKSKEKIMVEMMKEQLNSNKIMTNY